MKLTCRSCGKAIPADDINIDRAIAKCGVCNAVFSFADQLGGESSVARQRGEVPMPKGIVVDAWGPDLTITRRWFSPVFIFLIFFCCIWDGFLVVWYTISFTADVPGGGAWMMRLFPLIHVAVGVGLTYFTIAGFVNSTVINVRTGELMVKHGPMPWPGNRRIMTDELEQVYCTEHISHSKNGGVSRSYRANAVLRDGKKLKLLSGLMEADQALFIEQQLEQHLGIEDRPVGGEMPR